jgi:hypothetical protein
MWSRLDDELIDHAKVFAAGERSARTAPPSRSGSMRWASCGANKHLTDGFLPIAVV